MKKYFITLILLLCAHGFATAKHDLKYNLKAKQSFYMENTGDFTFAYDFPGTNIKDINATVESGLRLDVLNVDKDGNTTAKATFEKFNCIVGVPSIGKFEINTHKPKSLDFLNFVINIDAFVGQSLEITFTPKGEVTKVEGVEKIMDTIAAFCDEIDPTIKLILLPELSKSINAEQFRISFENSLKIYPENTISIGDVWKYATKIPSDQPMDYEIISKLTKPNMIEQKHLLKSSIVNPAGDLNMEMNGDGTVNLSDKTGLPQSATTKFSGEVKIESLGMILNFSGQSTLKIDPVS